MVVWSASTIGASDIFSQRFASTGTPLGSEFRVNTYTFFHYPDVASDPSGNFVVTWPAPGVIDGQRFASSGAPLGTEFRINTYTSATLGRPRVGADATANFVVVWQSDGQDGSSYGVFGQRFAGSGVSLGPEFRVNTYTTGAELFPAVVADASGNFVVVWYGQSQDQGSLFGQRFGQIVPVELMRFGVE